MIYHLCIIPAVSTIVGDYTLLFNIVIITYLESTLNLGDSNRDILMHIFNP